MTLVRFHKSEDLFGMLLVPSDLVIFGLRTLPSKASYVLNENVICLLKESTPFLHNLKVFFFNFDLIFSSFLNNNSNPRIPKYGTVGYLFC